MFMITCLVCGKLVDESGALDTDFEPCEHEIKRREEVEATNAH